MKRIRHLVLVSFILGITVAVCGLLYVFGTREALHAESERLIGEGEIYRASSPGLYPDFSVEEVARMSSLAVKGRVVSGRFLKKNASGEEGATGTQDDPVRLLYYAQFHVAEYLKGSGPDQITIALPGVAVGSSVAVREDSRLIQGHTYLLSLYNKEDYDERYLGPNVYRVYEGSYGRWKVEGDTLVSDDGRDVAMSLSEMRGKVNASCSSQIQPQFTAVILANQYCP